LFLPVGADLLIVILVRGIPHSIFLRPGRRCRIRRGRVPVGSGFAGKVARRGLKKNRKSVAPGLFEGQDQETRHPGTDCYVHLAATVSFLGAFGCRGQRVPVSQASLLILVFANPISPDMP